MELLPPQLPLNWTPRFTGIGIKELLAFKPEIPALPDHSHTTTHSEDGACTALNFAIEWPRNDSPETKQMLDQHLSRLEVSKMIELRDTIFIAAPPSKVWAWLKSMPEHYLDWHPDHVSCRWLTGSAFEQTAKMEVVERLHGKEHRFQIRLTDVEPEHHLDYHIGPGLNGSFHIEPKDSGTSFTATIRIGLATPLLGTIIDSLLRMMIPKRITALRQHQIEEGVNLKALLEGKTRVG